MKIFKIVFKTFFGLIVIRELKKEIHFFSFKRSFWDETQVMIQKRFKSGNFTEIIFEICLRKKNNNFLKKI